MANPATDLVLIQPGIWDDRSQALEALIERLSTQIDPTKALVYDLDLVDGSALSALAYQFDLLGPWWEAQATDLARRAFLKSVYDLQARRGTPWAIKAILAILGWPNARIVENQTALYYNGAATFNGAWWYGTGFGYWWQFGIELDLLGLGYTSTQHDQVRQVAQAFGPLRSRLSRVVLCLEDPATSGGGTPLWTGPTALDRFGAWDGSQWISRGFRATTIGPGNQARLDWRLFGLDGASGAMFTKIGLLRADGSVYAEVTRPSIYKGTDLELYGSWTITW